MTFPLLAVIVVILGACYVYREQSKQRKKDREAMERRIRRRYEAAIDVWPRPAGPKGGDWRKRRAS